MHIKDFEGWNKLKQQIDARADDSVPSIREREIWWVSIGVNVGDEENGKNELYNRPVLIVRKFNTRLFWGIPLTTKVKDNKLYFPITFKGQKGSVMLTHLRLYDAKRLKNQRSMMGTLPNDQFKAIRAVLRELLP